MLGRLSNHIHVAFTGTRAGMTNAQKQTVFAILTDCFPDRPVMLHHGNCAGADADMDTIAHACGLSVVLHPALVPESQSAGPGPKQAAVMCHLPQPPLVRNLAMVRASTLLIATPKEFHEVLRSGTWATIRAARRANLHRILVWPDGTVTQEPAEVSQLHQETV